MLEIGFLLDDAPRLGRPVEVDSHEIETLIENKSVLSHAGDSQHTQNIQINEVTVDYEKCVFYFTEKTERTFWPTQYKVRQDAPRFQSFPHSPARTRLGYTDSAHETYLGGCIWKQNQLQ